MFTERPNTSTDRLRVLFIIISPKPPPAPNRTNKNTPLSFFQNNFVSTAPMSFHSHGILRGPPKATSPPRNKALIAGLIKGNQWVFIVPDHKALLLVGVSTWHWGKLGTLRFPIPFNGQGRLPGSMPMEKKTQVSLGRESGPGGRPLRSWES